MSGLHKKTVLPAGCLCTLLSTAAAGQNGFRIEPNLKYGKPSDAGLALTTYPPDTTATAVVLFHTGKSYFKYSRDFQLYTEHCVRIKVLKTEGVEYANVTTPYYAPDDKESDKAGILRLNACAYNWKAASRQPDQPALYVYPGTRLRSVTAIPAITEFLERSRGKE